MTLPTLNLTLMFNPGWDSQVKYSISISDENLNLNDVVLMVVGNKADL